MLLVAVCVVVWGYHHLQLIQMKSILNWIFFFQSTFTLLLIIACVWVMLFSIHTLPNISTAIVRKSSTEWWNESDASNGSVPMLDANKREKKNEALEIKFCGCRCRIWLEVSTIWYTFYIGIIFELIRCRNWHTNHSGCENVIRTTDTRRSYNGK